MERTLPRWDIYGPVMATAMEEGPDQEKSLQPPSRRQRGTRSQSVVSVCKSNEGKQAPENNARERNRVRTLRQAFLSLQAALPSVPPNTKLSKLDVLILATSYIAHLTQTLGQGRNLPDSCQMGRGPGYLHPMKKWPMRARLYAEAREYEISSASVSHKD